MDWKIGLLIVIVICVGIIFIDRTSGLHLKGEKIGEYFLYFLVILFSYYLGKKVFKKKNVKI